MQSPQADAQEYATVADSSSASPAASSEDSSSSPASSDESSSSEDEQDEQCATTSNAVHAQPLSQPEQHRGKSPNTDKQQQSSAHSDAADQKAGDDDSEQKQPHASQHADQPAAPEAEDDGPEQLHEKASILRQSAALLISWAVELEERANSMKTRIAGKK